MHPWRADLEALLAAKRARCHLADLGGVRAGSLHRAQCFALFARSALGFGFRRIGGARPMRGMLDKVDLLRHGTGAAVRPLAPRSAWRCGAASSSPAFFAAALWALDRLLPAQTPTREKAARQADRRRRLCRRHQFVLRDRAGRGRARRHPPQPGRRRPARTRRQERQSGQQPAVESRYRHHRRRAAPWRVDRQAERDDGDDADQRHPAASPGRSRRKPATSPARSPACSTSRIGKTVGQLTSKVLDQRAELRGQVVVHAKPALTANWRLRAQPHLADRARR